MDTKYKKELWKEFELDDAVGFDDETLNDEVEVKPIQPIESNRQRANSLWRQLKRRASDNANTNQPSAPVRSTKSFPSPALASASKSTPANVISASSSPNVSKSTPTAAGKAKGLHMSSRSTGKKNADKSGPQRGSKRKRDQPIVLQPESRQHFKDMIFFYLPNNDVNPVRRLQIRKAIEYGAVWAQEWRDDITHIVADNDLTHEDVVSWITKNCVEAIPDSIILVKSNYPPDCIHYGFKMDPRQSAYYVKGYTPAQQAAKLETVLPQTTQVDEAERNRNDARQCAQAVTDQIADHAKGVSDEQQGEDREASQTQRSSLQVWTDVFNDDLSKEIREAQATKDLPLDLDDEEESSSSAVNTDDNDTSDEDDRSLARSKKPTISGAAQSGFVCMSKHDGQENNSNPNKHVIDTLQQMANVYDCLNDQWRTLAYRKAISQLRKQTEKITTKEQAKKLPYVGERLALKIQEIATTNRLRRLENVMLEPDEKVLKLFLGIYGVGTSQAFTWMRRGHRSLADLTSDKVDVTKNQQIGIDHYDDFNARIPRAEMTQHDDFVRRFASKLDPELQFTIGGSFRRGALDSGDIDFIVTKPGASAATIKTIMLDRIIRYLSKADYLKVCLSTSHHGDDGGSKWHGACSLPRPKGSTEPPLPWRRIDFLFVPWDEIGAALLYFTGNDIFNRSMRLLAGKKQMRLNQHGLYKDVMRGPGRKRLTDGTLVESHDEKKIFAALGVPWREPWERAC